MGNGKTITTYLIDGNPKGICTCFISNEKISSCGTVVDENLVELNQDLTFKSPSSASSFCIGNRSNGWLYWMNEEGQTLDEVYRKKEATILDGKP